MLKNKASAPTASSEKDRAHEKTFRIPISNGIFEHYSRLKDARWLLDLFIDQTTKEVPAGDGSLDGLVLGGKPIRDEDVTSSFRGQICSRTARRWRDRLARLGYIDQKRTPMGYVVRVKKSKKWAYPNTVKTKVIGQERPVRAGENVRSELPVVSDQAGHKCPVRPDTSVRSNKDSAVDSALQDKDGAVDTAAAAARLLQRQNEPQWKSIRISPTGSSDFQRVWESIYDTASEGEDVSDTMERCILVCQDSGIKVPPPFFDAKRVVEQGFADDDERLPQLEPFSRRVLVDGVPDIGNGELPMVKPFRRDPPEIAKFNPSTACPIRKELMR